MYVETSAKTSARAAISAFEVAGLASMGKIVSSPTAKGYTKNRYGLPPSGYYPTGTTSSTGSGSHTSNSPQDSLERYDNLSAVSVGTPRHFRQSSSASTSSGNPEQFWEQYSGQQQIQTPPRSVSVPRNPSVGSSRSASLSSSKTKSSTSIPSITSSLGSKTPKSVRKTSKVEQVEKTVTIKCQRLTADKTYEEIEVEVPAPIYETIQLYNDTGSLAARGGKERRKSIGTKLKNLFVKN